MLLRYDMGRCVDVTAGRWNDMKWLGQKDGNIIHDVYYKYMASVEAVRGRNGTCLHKKGACARNGACAKRRAQPKRRA